MTTAARFDRVVALVASVAVAAAAGWRSVPLRSGKALVSALAIGDSVIAAGLTEGGLRLVSWKGDRVVDVVDRAFGAKGRIHSVAWLSGRFVAATEGGVFFVDPRTGGLDREGDRMSIPDVRVLRTRGFELWMAGPKGVAVVDGGGVGRMRSWNLPASGSVVPQSMLVVGSKVLVGTSDAGLLVLDAATGTWTRLGLEEGMPGRQVSGLELVGSKIYAATERGVAVVELPLRVAGVVLPGVASGWLTQINGALVAATFDGLSRFDGATLQPKPFDPDSGEVPEGAVVFGSGMLLSGGASGNLLVRRVPTFLGSVPPRGIPDGVRLVLPAPLPASTRLVAQLRLPEWLAAGIPMETGAGGAARERILRFPGGTVGRFVLDVAVLVGEKVLERRTVEIVSDRLPPALDLDPVPGWVKDSVLRIKGLAKASDGVTVFRVGDARPVDVGDDGRFETAVRLARGQNLIRFRAIDASGNASEREVGVVRDDSAPALALAPFDTADGPRMQVRIGLREQNLSGVSIEPSGAATAIATDSALLLDFKDLLPGDNRFVIRLQDLAGNRVAQRLNVVRRGDDLFLGSARRPDPVEAAAPAPVSAGPAGDCAGAGSVRVLRYSMLEGETLRKLAERFYGDKELAVVLIRWNGLEDDSLQWRRMSVGTRLEIPIWRDMVVGRNDVEALLATMPKRRAP